MLSRHGIRSLCCAAVATAILGMSAGVSAADADKVKIGFLVKQAEEPWFQTEWQFAEKAGKDHGFEVIKIAVPDGEKTLSAIDSLAANGAKGFVICPPDVSLGPSIVAKAKANGLKVMAVDDRFVDAKGKFMEDVPYLGMAAFEVGQKQGAAMADEAKNRKWDWKETYAIINTYNELDTGKKRTDGSVDALKKPVCPKTISSSLRRKPSTCLAAWTPPVGAGETAERAKNLIIGGMNDNTVLGGVRATAAAGFTAANVIGIGINGTDAIGELKKHKVASSVRCCPALTKKATTPPCMMYEWVTTGKEPAEIHRDGRRDADHPCQLQGSADQIGLYK